MDKLECVFPTLTVQLDAEMLSVGPNRACVQFTKAALDHMIQKQMGDKCRTYLQTLPEQTISVYVIIIIRHHRLGGLNHSLFPHTSGG